MFKLVLLLLTVSGLQALPIAAPRGLQRTLSSSRLLDGFQQGTQHASIHKTARDGFRQGTEPSRKFLVDLNTGLVKEHMSEMDRRPVPVDVPAKRNGGGWVRVEEPSAPQLKDGFRQGTEPFMPLRDGFRQGTEPFMPIRDGFKQGTEPFVSIRDGFKQGTEPFVSIRDGFKQGTEPFVSIRDGFKQGTEPSVSIRDGFKQGTEPFMPIRDGFKQGTEPFMPIRDGFKQGTEPFMPLRDGFKQGTEPFVSIRDGFKQGTEPFMPLRDGFKQGTEPFMPIRDGFKQGTEPCISNRDGFRQGTEPHKSLPPSFKQGSEPVIGVLRVLGQGAEPSTSRLQKHPVACNGEVINGNCYEFNPTPLAFKEAQDLCRAHAPNAELASITSQDLHSRLVSMVTNGGERTPTLTWLGGKVKNQQASWVDGSEWGYSDWMPGHPNIHTDKPVCVEMFKIDESWWTAADCELRRASICSYSIAA